MEINKVHKMDCIEGLKQMSDSSVDLVLTDPPYGIGYYSNWSKDKDYRDKVKTVDGIKNDKDNILFLKDVASELYRVLKDNTHMYWFTRWDKVEEQKPMLEELGFKVKNNLIWMKNNWSMGDLKGAYAGQYECILFCQKGRRELNEVEGKKRHADILQFDRIPPNKLLHSHQKPTDLLKLLIQKSTKEGEVVLDSFMGCGSTAVACLETNRKYIGFELDDEIYELGENRLNTYIS